MPRSRVVKPARVPAPRVRSSATGKFIKKSVDLSTSGNIAQNEKPLSADPEVPNKEKKKQPTAFAHWLCTVPYSGSPPPDLAFSESTLSPNVDIVPGNMVVVPNSTTVVPKGDVTLNPLSPAGTPLPTHRSPPNMEGTSWCSTNSTDSTTTVPAENTLECHVIRDWVIEHCHDATWQLEVGKQGYVHWQVYLNLKKRRRLTWLKAHFHSTAHLEHCKSIDKSNAYCFKTDTRLQGPYHWPEPAEAAAVQDPLAGKVLRPWQQQVIDIVSGPICDRTVHWFWEELGNSGKSTLAKHLVLKHGAVVIQGAGKDILHQASKCKDTKLFILDIPRCADGHVSYQAIESLKNGLWFSGKYEGSMCVRNPAHVVCFSNQTPEQSRLSRDRWHIVNILEADGVSHTIDPPFYERL